MYVCVSTTVRKREYAPQTIQDNNNNNHTDGNTVFIIIVIIIIPFVIFLSSRLVFSPGYHGNRGNIYIYILTRQF